MQYIGHYHVCSGIELASLLRSEALFGHMFPGLSLFFEKNE